MREVAPRGKEQALLRTIGEALYGDRWQAELARALDVEVRAVHRWLAGQNDVPEGVWSQLLDLLRVREGDLMNARHKLERRMATYVF